MAFRDPLDAARARIEALEAELERLREGEGRHSAELASLHERLAGAEEARLRAEADLAIARNDAEAQRAIGDLDARMELATIQQTHDIALVRLREELETVRTAAREENATLRARCEALEDELARLRAEISPRGT